MKKIQLLVLFLLAVQTVLNAGDFLAGIQFGIRHDNPLNAYFDGLNANID